MGVLKTLHVGDYHVTVVSSETFTTFTPLLTCMLYHPLLESLTSSRSAAVVGTVQVRSLIEPIRKIIARLRGHFVQGKAVDLDMKQRLLEVETMTPDGKTANVYIPCVHLFIMSPCMPMTPLGTTNSLSPLAQLQVLMAFRVWKIVSNSRQLRMHRLSVAESWV